MKWLEYSHRSLDCVESMIRLWKSFPEHAQQPLDTLRERLYYDVKNGLFEVSFGPGFRLDGFATWWRIDDELMEYVQESDTIIPTYYGPAQLVNPKWVYVGMACARDTDTLRFIMRGVRKENKDCRPDQFITWRKGRLRKWSAA